MKKVTNDFILDQLKNHQMYVTSHVSDTSKVILSANSIFTLASKQTIQPVCNIGSNLGVNLKSYYKHAFEGRDEEFRMLLGLPAHHYFKFLYPDSLGFFLSNKLQSAHAVKVINELVKVFGELDISSTAIEYFVISTLNILFSTDLKLIYGLNSGELLALVNESRVVSVSGFGTYPKSTPFDVCVRTSFFNFTPAQKKSQGINATLNQLADLVQSKARYNTESIRMGLSLHTGYILLPELINRCLNSINFSILTLDYRCRLIAAIKNSGDEEYRKLVVELFNSLDVDKFVTSTAEARKAKTLQRGIDKKTKVRTPKKV